MTTKKTTARCSYSETRNGKLLRCERAPGHEGDHEVQDAPKPGRFAVRIRLPADIEPEPKQIRAYLCGAADFALGPALDRLAKELEVAPRAAGESDHDFGLRVRKHVGLPR